MSQRYLLSPYFGNIFCEAIRRVLDTGLTDTSRPIMANTVTAGVTLPPGTYWLDWQTDGSLSSGPWAPPFSILGQTTTGNAMQYTTGWASITDTGTLTPQGLPFILDGTISTSDLIVSSLSKGVLLFRPVGYGGWYATMRNVSFLYQVEN